MNYPKDTFGAHIVDGSLGKIGDREIGPGHVVLSEERYQWLLAHVRRRKPRAEIDLEVARR